MASMTGAVDHAPSSAKLYMGPLKGFTDHIYRNTFERHFGGFDLAVAPFIVGTGSTKIHAGHVKGLLPQENTAMPVVPQILSKSAAEFAPPANYLYDLGYETVNWNLGCPFPMVVKKNAVPGCCPIPI